MSLIRFLIAFPLLVAVSGILEAARFVVGDVTVVLSPVKQMMGFLAAGFCLIFALTGKAIAGKQPIGTHRYKWFERF